MVRSRIVLIVVGLGLLYAAAADAQMLINGIVSGQIGASFGGDTERAGVTPSASLAVVESDGWGVELDLGHSRSFAGEAFDDSAITSLMVNALYIQPHPRLRPYGAAGVGLLRVRAAIVDEQPVVHRTDWGLDAGGGVVVMLNDAVGIRGDVRYFRYVQRHDDLPLSRNGYFDFWRTSLGVTWTWPIR